MLGNLLMKKQKFELQFLVDNEYQSTTNMFFKEIIGDITRYLKVSHGSVFIERNNKFERFGGKNIKYIKWVYSYAKI